MIIILNLSDILKTLVFMLGFFVIMNLIIKGFSNFFENKKGGNSKIANYSH